MATGTQVPWTDPGGTPCCCEEKSCAENTFISNTVDVVNFSSGPIWSQTITPALYSDCTGTSPAWGQFKLRIEIKINAIIQPSYPNGIFVNFSQYALGQDYEVLETTGTLFPTIYPSCWSKFSTEKSVPLWNYATNSYWTSTLRGTVMVQLRNGGDGWTSALSSPPTSTSPALYASGMFYVSSVSNLSIPISENPLVPGYVQAPSSVRYIFDEQLGTTAGSDNNLFGYQTKSTRAFVSNGGTHSIDWKVSVNPTAP